MGGEAMWLLIITLHAQKTIYACMHQHSARASNKQSTHMCTQGSPYGEAVLEARGLNQLTLWANVAVLFAYYVFWRSLLYVILRIDKPKFDRSL